MEKIQTIQIKMKKVLVYDGSFQGFLSVIYEVFDSNITEPEILRSSCYNPDMFTTGQIILTDEEKASKVWNSLTGKVSRKTANELYRCILSEIKGVEQVLLRYIVNLYVREEGSYVANEKMASRISQVAKMVGREKVRLEEELSFELTKDGMYQAIITPDFNVLPLLGNYFKKQYPFQRWVIYDKKRKNGVYYNLNNVEHFRSGLADFLRNQSVQIFSKKTPAFKNGINKGKLIFTSRVEERRQVV